MTATTVTEARKQEVVPQQFRTQSTPNILILSIRKSTAISFYWEQMPTALILHKKAPKLLLPIFHLKPEIMLFLFQKESYFEAERLFLCVL